jgi:monothiol glutaredoxin
LSYLGLTEYKAINILDNPIIREQVKLYSKWPTYPQLYIAGELVGGSDILHEMHKDQSLQKLLSDKGLI